MNDLEYKKEKIEEDFKKLTNVENHLQRRKALIGKDPEFFLNNYECYLDPSLFETRGFSRIFHSVYDNTIIGKGTFFVDKNYLQKVLVKKIEQHQLHVRNNPNYDSRYNEIYNLLKECERENKISYRDLPTVNENDNSLINYVKDNKYKRICIFVVDPDEKEAVNNYDKYINNLDIEEYPFFELIRVKRYGERLEYTRVLKEIPTGKEDPRIIEMKNFDIKEIENQIKEKENTDIGKTEEELIKLNEIIRGYTKINDKTFVFRCNDLQTAEVLEANDRYIKEILKVSYFEDCKNYLVVSKDGGFVFNGNPEICERLQEEFGGRINKSFWEVSKPTNELPNDKYTQNEVFLLDTIRNELNVQSEEHFINHDYERR